MNTSFPFVFARRLLRIAAHAAPLAAAATMSCGGYSTDNCGGPGNPQQVCLGPSDAGATVADAGPCPSGESEEAALASLVSAPAADIVSGPVKQGSMCCYMVRPQPVCP